VKDLIGRLTKAITDRRKCLTEIEEAAGTTPTDTQTREWALLRGEQRGLEAAILIVREWAREI